MSADEKISLVQTCLRRRAADASIDDADEAHNIPSIKSQTWPGAIKKSNLSTRYRHWSYFPCFFPLVAVWRWCSHRSAACNYSSASAACTPQCSMIIQTSSPRFAPRGPRRRKQTTVCHFFGLFPNDRRHCGELSIDWRRDEQKAKLEKYTTSINAAFFVRINFIFQ